MDINAVSHSVQQSDRMLIKEYKSRVFLNLDVFYSDASRCIFVYRRNANMPYNATLRHITQCYLFRFA
jgi:hypothetical protein